MDNKEVLKKLTEYSKEDRDSIVWMVIGGMRAYHNQEVNDMFELMMSSIKSTKEDSKE